MTEKAAESSSLTAILDPTFLRVQIREIRSVGCCRNLPSKQIHKQSLKNWSPQMFISVNSFDIIRTGNVHRQSCSFSEYSSAPAHVVATIS